MTLTVGEEYAALQEQAARYLNLPDLPHHLAEAELRSDRRPGVAHHAAVNRVRFAIEHAELRRSYKRDPKGRFSSGGGGGGGGGGGTPEQMHDEAVIRATFGYHDQATGVTATVTSIRGGDPGRSTYVDIRFTDRQGNVVGQASRTIHAAGSKSVAHSGSALAPDMQGQGFMTRYNQQVEQSYREHGIERIEIHASAGFGMVGGYAWARAGYDFANADARFVAGHLAQAQSQLKGYSPSVQAEVARVAANPNALPIEYAMIGWTPGAATWPGKEIMLETPWDGVKEL